MGLQSETRNIEGYDVTVMQFDFIRSSKLMAKLGKLIFPALGGSLSGLDIAALFNAIDPAELPGLMGEVLSQTTVVMNGKQFPLDRQENINLAFNGNLKFGFSVLRFALEVNYRNFWSAGFGSDDPSPAAGNP